MGLGLRAVQVEFFRFQFRGSWTFSVLRLSGFRGIRPTVFAGIPGCSLFVVSLGREAKNLNAPEPYRA